MERKVVDASHAVLTWLHWECRGRVRGWHCANSATVESVIWTAYLSVGGESSGRLVTEIGETPDKAVSAQARLEPTAIAVLCPENAGDAEDDEEESASGGRHGRLKAWDHVPCACLHTPSSSW